MGTEVGEAGTEVLAIFTHPDGEPLKVTAPVGADGTWSLAYPKLESGSWEATVRARDSRGAQSDPVGPFAVSSGSAISVLMGVVIGAALMAACALVLLILFYRRDTTRIHITYQ